MEEVVACLDLDDGWSCELPGEGNMTGAEDLVEMAGEKDLVSCGERSKS